jgi:hypothetical protein
MPGTTELPAHAGTGEQSIARITSFGQIRFMKSTSALSAFASSMVETI